MQANDSFSQLTTKQRTFLDCLMAGNTIITSAAAARVSETTAHRWLKRPDIQAARAAAEQRVFDHALRRLLGLVDKAVDVLDAAMSNDEVSMSTRVRASLIVIEQALTTLKASEIEASIKQLAQLIEEQQQAGRNGSTAWNGNTLNGILKN